MAKRTHRWLGVVASALGLALVGFAMIEIETQGLSSAPLSASIGGPFELTRVDGTRFKSTALAGRPYLAFFGYTSCPDVCPTTLANLSNLLADLKGDADKLTVLYISVDPERDTPEHLKAFLSAFDPRIVGLTGTVPEIDAVAKAYRIIHQKVPGSDGGYTINHTALVYVMDRRGGLAATLSDDESEADGLKKLKRVIAGS